MSIAREIPLGPAPVRFVIVLAGREYLIRVYFRDSPEAGWHLDIGDSATGLPIINCIPLVVGVDLLEQYKYLDFGFQLFLVSDKPNYEPPTFDDLGIKTHLLFVVPESA